MLILFPGLYVISATLFCVSLGLMIAGDMCKQHGDIVKSKPPQHAQQTSRTHRKRRRKGHKSEARPLLRDMTGRHPSTQESESSNSEDSDCGDFLEIDEREQKEAQEAVDSPAAASGGRQRPIAIVSGGGGGGGASNVVSPQRRPRVLGRAANRGRVRGYGTVSDVGPAPVVGSVSEWSVASLTVKNEKRWLAESQEGI